MTDAQIRQNSMDQLSDEELVRLALCDREALSALIIRYYPIAVCKARKMAHDGSDADDILQEGVLGLLDAVKSFDKDNGAAFRTYANICMRNRMLNAVSAAARKSEALEDIEEQQDSESSPESIVVQREHEKLLFENISHMLSVNEWSVLQLYLNALPYSEIAKRLGVSVKSVDNAMQRVRKKLKKNLTNFGG